MSRDQSPPPQNVTRLSVEPLEARDCPAAYYWSPIDGLGTGQPENWLMGQGLPALRHTYPPNGDDHLYFGPSWSGGNTDAYLRPSEGAVPIEFPPPDTDLHYAGIHLMAGYTKRVTVQTGDVLVGTFGMHGGTLRQADSELMDRTDPPEEWPIDWEPGPGATALTVDETFHWTGGTINDGDLAGQLNLAPGATGLAEPSEASPINSFVALGSTFNLLGNAANQTGSTLEVNSGTYNVTDGGGFVVKKGSTINIIPKVLQPVKAVVVIDDCEELTGGTLVTIEEGSEGTIAAKQRPPGNTTMASFILKGRTPILTNHGTVSISDLTELAFDPAPNRSGGYLQTTSSESEVPVPPVTTVEAGCAITCNLNTQVDIKDGKFLTVERSVNGTPLADQPVIRITSDANIGFNLGRDALFGRSGNATKPIKVLVEGDGALRADGTFEMYVDHSSDDRDQFVVEAQIIFDPNAAVKAFWFTPGPPSSNYGIGSEWVLFESASEADEPINVAPAFTKPPAAPSLEIRIMPDKKQIRVRRDA